MEREASEILRMLENAKKETKVAKDWDRAVDHQLRAAQYEVNSLETALQGLDETIAQGPDLASYVRFLSLDVNTIHDRIMFSKFLYSYFLD